MRGRWARNEPFSTDDTYRALDSAYCLLGSLGAAEEAEVVDRG
ncbi:MAG: hypothetical protein MSC31_12910 [Solirubrobacteraceae bacterium MAG38_C4-C5]|nr:hypothetical protein [Candidatus Siliceabacter maunaloa]